MPLQKSPSEIENDILKVNEESLQKHLGAMNHKNPLKITSNTMITNPTRIVAYHLFNKDYNELDANQRQEVFRTLNTSEDQLEFMALSHEYGQREVNSKKKSIPEPGKFKVHRPMPPISRSPDATAKKNLMALPHIRNYNLGNKKFDHTERKSHIVNTMHHDPQGEEISFDDDHQVVMKKQ